MHKLSAYVLTKNSEKYLTLVLQQLSKAADEIVVIDSGSKDNTQNIVRTLNIHFIQHEFEDFVTQRNFAAQQCAYDWVLFVDSDEILSDRAIEHICYLKQHGFKHDAYTIQRNWFILGRPVKCMLPVVSPDYPIRLFYKKTTCFQATSNIVHESPTGFTSKGIIQGEITHYTFNSKSELYNKLKLYTDLAAYDLISQHRTVNYFKYFLSPSVAFIKYYFLKKGYYSGRVGLIIGIYAYNYTKSKYKKALILRKKNNQK